MVDAVELWLKIIFPRRKDVFDPRLRVSVDERKPRTLDLDQQAVTSLERVMYVA